MSSKRLIGLMFCLGVWLLAAPVSAHQNTEKIRAIASLHPADLVTPTGPWVADVLILHEIPRGDRAQRLMARFDLDRSGELSPLEAQALAAEIGPESVGGYVLRFDERAPRPTSLQTTATVTEGGGIAVALMLVYDLPACAGVSCRLAIDVLRSPGGDTPVVSRPMVVEIQVARSLRLVASSHPLAPDAPVVGGKVEPGEGGVWVDVSPTPAVESP